MRTTNKAAYALLVGLLFAACSQDDNLTENNGNKNAAKGITATVESFKTDKDSRTTLNLDDNYGLTFKWSDADKVGVFGKTGMSQTQMEITAGTGTGKATFTCESFQLAADKQYCAYLPYYGTAETGSSVTEAKIPVSYEEQIQTENGSTAHLGSFDYLVSDVTTPATLNTANFTFKHMGSAVRLKITMPEAGKWTKLTLAAADGSKDAFVTSAYLNLFSDTYGCKALETAATASQVVLKLGDDNGGIATTAGDPMLTAWIMLAPTAYFNATDAKGMVITVTSDEGKEYDAVITPKKEFKRGYAYSLSTETTATSDKFLAGKFLVGSNKYVTFATGNLQYDIANKTYLLAENQWQVCTVKGQTSILDESNKYIQSTSNTNYPYIIDLFGWGTANKPTYVYINLSATGNALNAGNYYLGEFDEVGNPREDIEKDLVAFSSANDWGTVAANQIGGLTGARTLTAEEWGYLLKNQYCALTQLTSGSNQRVLGLVVFPSGTDESTAKSYLTNTSPTVYKISGNNTTITTTVKMQTTTVEKLTSSGALFLPVAGQRTNNKVDDATAKGYYWTASSAKTSGEAAYTLCFYNSKIELNNYFNRRYGQSVRLAKDVTE